jgi:flagellar basal-body rod modification protein FlgD
MNINPTAATTSTTTNDTSSTSQGTDDMFMQLLMAQLKNQSPLDPVDPDQFVGQLVQFNTLDEIIQIRELLQQVTGTTTTGNPTSTQGVQ